MGIAHLGTITVWEIDYDGMCCKTMGEKTEDKHHSSARIGLHPAMWIILGKVVSVEDTGKTGSRGSIKCEVCFLAAYGFSQSEIYLRYNK